MTNEDIKQKALDDFDKAQELEYKIGRFIVITALIFEIINLIPGTIFGNLWFCPGALNTPFIIVLSRLLPTLGLVFSICAYKGFPVGRYCLAVIYGINLFRIGINLPVVLGEFPALLKTDHSVVLPTLIILSVVIVLSLAYNMIMCISMVASKNVSNYMYTKLTKS